MPTRSSNEKIRNLEAFLEDPTLEEITQKLGVDHKEDRRVTAALRNAGWSSRRSRSGRFWSPPEA